MRNTMTLTLNTDDLDIKDLRIQKDEDGLYHCHIECGMKKLFINGGKPLFNRIEYINDSVDFRCNSVSMRFKLNDT